MKFGPILTVNLFFQASLSGCISLERCRSPLRNNDDEEDIQKDGNDTDDVVSIEDDRVHHPESVDFSKTRNWHETEICECNRKGDYW